MPCQSRSSPTLATFKGLAQRGLCAILTTTSLWLAGCATPAPVDQIKYFSQAFTAVNTVGQPLLDDLAVAERVQGKQVALRRAKGESTRGPEECQKDRAPWQLALDGKSGIINGFCSADAGYFSDLGDPPATAILRGGLSIIERYADVLGSLAEGRNLEQALGQVDTLGQEVGGLLELVGAGSVAIAPALTALKPLLESAAKQANQAEARRLIMAGAPRVTALIAALSQAAPALFGTLIEASATRLLRPDAGGAVVGEIARVDAYRVAVSQYVVLLDRVQKAWDNTIAAAAAPNAGQGRLASLVAASAELRADAIAVRKGFAALRAGAVPATAAR